MESTEPSRNWLALAGPFRIRVPRPSASKPPPWPMESRRIPIKELS